MFWFVLGRFEFYEARMVVCGEIKTRLVEYGRAPRGQNCFLGSFSQLFC